MSDLYKYRGARFSVAEIYFVSTKSSYGAYFYHEGKRIEFSSSILGEWPNGWRERNLKGRKVYI